ncbi:MAG: glycosyltransferase family 1 protein [Candidatus Moranbacteria bacterium]|nr:glycosyltransferase family 1 protein [Candidatus Moranbacteria bacterium]
MAKIGIDIRAIGKNRTGDEVYFFNLVKNLAKIDKGSEYSLYTDRDPKKDSALAKEIKKLNLGQNFKVIFIKKINRFCWNFWYLPMCLRKNQINIYHTQYIAPFWLPKKIKLVLTIHDISFNFFPEYIKKTDLFFLKALLPRSIRQADKIITVSASEQKQIIDFYKISPEKVDFTHNGVDFEGFGRNFSDEQKNAVKAKYKLPEKFLLYIGTLQPRKNIPVIIEAMKSLDTNLVLAGNREARNFDKKIDNAIEKNNLGNKVIFPGWIDEEDKPVLLQLADCFVFPSLYEGFGIPIIEAMAAGTPIVCSDIPVFREIAESSALFCDPKNSRQFAENILKILNDQPLKEKLVQSGIETAKKFAWQKTAEKTLGIYRQTVK